MAPSCPSDRGTTRSRGPKRHQRLSWSRVEVWASVPRLSFGAKNDSLRWVALTGLSVTAGTIIAECSRRLGDIACCHHARRTHHDFVDPARGGLRNSSIGRATHDTKWKWGRDAISAVLTGCSSESLRSWRAGRSDLAGISLVSFIALVALHPTTAQGQGRDQGTDQDHRSFHVWNPG